MTKQFNVCVYKIVEFCPVRFRRTKMSTKHEKHAFIWQPIYFKRWSWYLSEETLDGKQYTSSILLSIGCAKNKLLKFVNICLETSITHSLQGLMNVTDDWIGYKITKFRQKTWLNTNLYFILDLQQNGFRLILHVFLLIYYHQ